MTICISCNLNAASSDNGLCNECNIEIVQKELDFATQELEECNTAIHELITEIFYLNEEIRKLRYRDK